MVLLQLIKLVPWFYCTRSNWYRGYTAADQTGAMVLLHLIQLVRQGSTAPDPTGTVVLLHLIQLVPQASTAPDLTGTVVLLHVI